MVEEDNKLKTIWFLKSVSKKCFIKEYLDYEVPKSTKYKIIEQMMLLEKYGLKYGYVKTKKFQNEMHKIRLNDGNNNCRIYFIIIENVIYYLFAYNKKTQKTAENLKVKINNLKDELLMQIKNNLPYLKQYINLKKMLV